MDGGPATTSDAPVVVTDDTHTKQSGKIVQVDDPDTVVANATVEIAGVKATTGADGTYQLLVPRNTPYQMKVTAESFYALVEQEWVVTKPELDRGATSLLKSALGSVLANLLPGRKPELGTLAVKVVAQAPCTTAEGTVLTLDPPGEAMLRYFDGNFPDDTLTATKAGGQFSGAFYNVAVGVPVTVKGISPGCTQIAFPVVDSDVSYTGKATTEGGPSLTFTRVFMGAPIKDAGHD